MTHIQYVLLLAAAHVFLLAASYKVIATGALASTLMGLGLSERPATAISRLACSAEISIAILVLSPVSFVRVVTLVVVGAVLVSAGIRGTTLSTAVRCACFSADSANTVGWRQLLLGSALGCIAILEGVDGATMPFEGWVLRVCVVTAIAIATRLAAAAPLLATLVRGRRALAATYPV